MTGRGKKSEDTYCHMRSRFITFAPASSVIPIMRPSTWAGTPMTKFSGTLGPSRSLGHAALTASTFPPMPPEETRTAEPYISNSPLMFRFVLTPLGESSGSRVRPLTPTTLPVASSTSSLSTWWRNLNWTRPSFSMALTGSAKTLTISGPTPQVMWKRGTEFPWPSALPAPLSAQPTLKRKPMPRALRYFSMSSVAKFTKASAHLRGQWSSFSRSKAAEANQSRMARSRESLMPMRRCSVLSTQKMPPRDQKAWPPRLPAFSWSMMTTGTLFLVSSKAATRPARPPPTMRTGFRSVLEAMMVDFSLSGKEEKDPIRWCGRQEKRGRGVALEKSGTA